MTDQSSIQYISHLLDSPASVTRGDHSIVESLIRTYPYLVPLRYIAAVESRTSSGFSPEMLAKARPYLGNWMKYCEFAAAATQAPVITQLVASEPVTYDHHPPVQEYVPEAAVSEPVANEYQPPVQEYVPEPQVEDTGAPEEIAVPGPAIADTPETIADQEDSIADQIAAEIKHEAGPEPVVKVSDEFLQLIREETPVAPEPLGIVPQPVFKAGDEQPSPGHNEASDEYEIAEEAVPTAEPAIVTLHVVTPAVDEPAVEAVSDTAAEALISPIYTQDYFLQQGEKISEEIPVEIADLKESADADEVDKSLMVMMSFSEWLLHFKSTTRKQEEEKKDQRALKTMWQKEKLAAALEEENEEIPENVFEMAVNSIAKEDGLASESLAEIYIKQGKYDKAMDMYRKLSLRNPQKNAYFARKIEEVLKEKQS